MNTTEGQPTTAPAGMLETARRELVNETVAGRGGLAAVERYADRIDALLQRVFAEAPRSARPVTIIALGGYGRRHQCLHSDVDLLVLFDGPIGLADEQECHRVKIAAGKRPSDLVTRVDPELVG